MQRSVTGITLLFTLLLFATGSVNAQDMTWSFESGNLGDWALVNGSSNPYSTTGGVTSTRAFDGANSVEVSVASDATSGALQNTNADNVAPGDVFEYRVYIESGQASPVASVQTYLNYGSGYTYYDNYYGSLNTDQWETVMLEVPEDAAGDPGVRQFGIQVNGNSASDTPTIYVDQITYTEASGGGESLEQVQSFDDTDLNDYSDDNPDYFGSYGADANGNFSFTQNASDAIEGNSVELDYTIDGDANGYGGDITLQDYGPHDFSAYNGLRIHYKATQQASPTGQVTFNLQIFEDTDTGDGELYEFSSSDVYDDASGAWQSLTMPFSEFTRNTNQGEDGDGQMDFGDILEYRIQIFDGSADGSETSGTILFDQLEGGASLPVELTSFDAVTSGGTVMLRWRTASETNNVGFEVEQRRHGGAWWKQVGYEDGHGTTAEPHVYMHSLADLAAGRYTFRLRQVDRDGGSTYSPEVPVSIGVRGTHELSRPHPNPFVRQARFTLAVAEKQPVRVEVFSTLGRRVAVLHDGPLTARTAHPFVVEAGDLPSGIYFVRAQGASFTATRQFVLAR